MGVTYRHTILNVDDDEGGRYAKTKIFERAGYRVIEGGSGSDALRLVREERPQLVLLDVGLPDINGIEVCRSIKTNAETARTMVLQLSASSIHPQDRAVGLDGGADVYLSEPVEAAELLGAAKALLRLYDREQESRVLLKELTERERFIKTLVDAAPSTVYLYDLDEQRNLYANARSGAALGYAPEELQLVGCDTLRQWVHPEDLPLVAARLASLTDQREDDLVEFECRLQHRSKEWRWFLSRNVVFSRDVNGRPTQILGTALDITDRKEQDALLLSGKEQQALLLDVSRMILEMPVDRVGWTKAIFEKISGPLDIDLCLNYVLDQDTKGFDLLVGLGLPEALGPKAQHLNAGEAFCGSVAVHGISITADAQLIDSDPRGEFARSLGARAYACHPLKASDGRVLGALSFGTTRKHSFTEQEIEFLQTLCHLIALAWERHSVSHALGESESRLKAIVDSAVDGIITVSDQGVIHSANPAVERMFGHRLDALIGADIASLMPRPYDRPAENEEPASRSLINGRLKGLAPEMLGSRKDGSSFPVELSISENHRGDDVTYTLVIRDITERKKAQEQIHRWAIELEQRVSERTRELLDSRTRLRALASDLTLTEQRERQRLATELHDYLAQLLVFGRLKVSQARRGNLGPAAGIVQELDDMLVEALTYTRSLVAQLSPPVLREFGLAVAIKWLAEQMRRHEMTVAVHCDLDLEPLREDHAVLLFQSARELLINVSKHAGTKQASITVEVKEAMLHLCVADEGVGFDQASSVTNPSSPMFGLFSIRERMDALGGRMVIDSSPGRGTKITLVVPYIDATASDDAGDVGEREAKPSPKKSAQPPPVTASDSNHVRRTRVLLADDHAMVRQGLRTVLEAYSDLEVVGEAANGEQAVMLAKSLAPEVVVMDINMPGMDGIEATRLLKQEQPETIVIGLSVHNSVQVEQVMREAGAVSFLPKDAAIEQLHETIQQALRSKGSVH